MRIRSRSAYRRGTSLLVHLLLWAGALYASLLIRFDGAPPASMVRAVVRTAPLVLAVRAVLFWREGLFQTILRYSGVVELRSLVRATTMGSILIGLAGLLVHRLGLPRSIYFLEWTLALGATGALRLGARLLHDGPPRTKAQDNPSTVRAIMLGAGNAGDLFLKDLARANTPNIRVVAVLDDEPGKHGSLFHGVPVAGPITEELLRLSLASAQTRRVIMAIPSASGERTREIVAMCQRIGAELKTLPSPQQIADGSIRVTQLRDVAIEDLLRRDPVELDTPRIEQSLRGRRVLVTGAAGSIGSELVRQIARFAPSELVLFDHNENGLFYLDRELAKSAPDVRRRVCIGSIRDAHRVREIFGAFRPDVVYHAAAHKHVPVMEANPAEAVRNNVVGTRVVADAAAEFGCDAFVLISTDKAVNPTSVMGTTKRVAEMYLQSLARRSRTRFCAVRFGNVLGSAGSVVPLFRAQIEAGGPVQVTHPDMKRYFMTIPEACQLVLQASVLGRGGEIFILHMGEPVRIVDLARDLITLSGFRTEDIGIEFTGVRPGEKICEELTLDRERSAETDHPKVRIAVSPEDAVDLVPSRVGRLERLVERVVDAATIRAELSALVPEARLMQPNAAVDTAGAVATMPDERGAGAAAPLALEA